MPQTVDIELLAVAHAQPAQHTLPPQTNVDASIAPAVAVHSLPLYGDSASRGIITSPRNVPRDQGHVLGKPGRQSTICKEVRKSKVKITRRRPTKVSASSTSATSRVLLNSDLDFDAPFTGFTAQGHQLGQIYREMAG